MLALRNDWQVTFLKALIVLRMALLGDAMKIKDLQNMQEKVTIHEFLRAKNLMDNHVSYPDPPDCIVSNGVRKIWIEETSIYRHRAQPLGWNHDKYEYSGTHEEYQKELIKKVIDSIKKKDSKFNYCKFTNEFGQGVLLLRIQDPLFCWPRDLIKVLDPHNYTHLELHNFSCVYLYNSPVITVKESSDSMVWVSKIINIDKFFLIA